MILGYKLRLNGGTFTDEIIDVGIPDLNENGFLHHLVTGLVAGTEYAVEVSSYDLWLNQSDWSEPVLYTTPADSLIWTNHIDVDWTIDGSMVLTAINSTYSGYHPEIVPHLINVGEYIEFTFLGNAASMQMRLRDNSGHFIVTYGSGQIDTESGFLGYYNAYTDDDFIRFTRISSTQVEQSLNGGGTVTIPQNFTGEIIANVDTLSVIGNIIGTPTTNIIF